MGNHRDAWMFGAVDPTSGTAVMMEISRVLSDLVKKGKLFQIGFNSRGYRETKLNQPYRDYHLSVRPTVPIHVENMLPMQK